MTDWLTDLYAGSDEARFTDSESESWQSEAERSLHQTKHCLQTHFWLARGTYKW